jgi:hypothetical protein
MPRPVPPKRKSEAAREGEGEKTNKRKKKKVPRTGLEPWLGALSEVANPPAHLLEK